LNRNLKKTYIQKYSYVILKSYLEPRGTTGTICPKSPNATRHTFPLVRKLFRALWTASKSSRWLERNSSQTITAAA